MIWYFVSFAAGLMAGGSIGYWVCAAMYLAKKADQADDAAFRDFDVRP